MSGAEASSRPAVNADEVDPGPDWWALWNKDDFSWSGLAAHPWEGWAWDPAAERAIPVGPEAEGLACATLQHQWWSHRDVLFTDPGDGRAYTVAHLPLRWSNGSPSPKSDGQTAGEVDDQVALALAEIAQRCAGWRLDLSGVVLASRTTLALPAQAPISLRAHRAYAAGTLSIRDLAGGPARLAALSLDACLLERDLDIEGGVIDGDVRLTNQRGSEIAGDLNARNLRIGGRLRGRFTVCGQAIFDSADFGGDVLMEDCRLGGRAEFGSARFRGHAQFSRTVFGQAQYGGATFEKSAEFIAAAFLQEANFADAGFAGASIFAEAAFADAARFPGAGFGGSLHLHGTRFEGTADFSGRAAPATDRNPQAIRLHREAGPEGGDRWVGGFAAEDLLAAFSRRSFQTVDASQAVFVGDADFSNRDILQPSTFAGARFLGDARFHGSRLHQRVNFHDTGFEALDYEALRPGAARVGGRWPDASPVLVDARRRRDGKAPLRALKDDRLQFGRAMAPERERLEQERRDRVAAGLTPDRERQTDARLEALEASFRTLKLAMEDTRARLSESRFFKMELRARRRRRDTEVPGWERFLSMAYGLTADYGDSIARPVLFFLGVAAAFALAYWGLAALETGRGIQPGDLGDALRYSLSRMTPFGAMGDQDRWAWLDGWQNEGSLFSWAGLLRITATFQSALALVLTFLFALAVRRRFQIV